MANNSIALGVEVPNFGNSFAQGQEAGQARQMNSMKMEMAQREQGREEALQLMQMLGSAGMYALNGDMKGTPDPAKWDEAMDGLAQFGLDSAKYKGKPQLASVLVNASLSAADQIKMAKDDQQFALTLQKLDQDLAQHAESMALRREGLDIQRERIAKSAETAAAKANKLSATELKAVHGAEDELPLIDNTIATLNRALELNAKTSEGMGANQVGRYGTYLPDSVEPATAAPTREYLDIMTQEAAAQMSAVLKGATTDRELGIFMDIISDASKPKDQRERALRRMIELAEKKKATAARRIEELKGAPSSTQSDVETDKAIEDMTDAELEALINGE